jgi:uncharacterized protein (DUF2062 family)
MNSPFRKTPPVRPWWRTPIRYLLKVRPRRRHVHGTLVHRLLGERVFHSSLWVPERDAVARGMAIGMFVGFLPVPGLQIFFSALVCYALRSNIAVAALATFVTNPFTAPAIVWAQYQFGVWLLPYLKWTSHEYAGAGGNFLSYGKPFLVGSLTSSVVFGLLSYPLTHWTWNVVEAAVLRRRRHAAAARAAEAEERRLTAKENAED